jgi:ATP-dependent DNA helicase 2 subunit 2
MSCSRKLIKELTVSSKRQTSREVGFPHRLECVSRLTHSIAPDKITGKRKGDAAADTRPISGFDSGASILAGREKKKLKVTKENAIPEFKQILRSLSTVETDEGVETAMTGMGEVICSLIKESFGDKNYDQAMENIGVMREQMIGLEMPQLYNDFLRDLKNKLNSEVLGGDRRDMWHKIRWSGKLGLITRDESETSTVSKDDAQSVGAPYSDLPASG